jgi:GT2 family glycosyltransferase
MLKIAVIILNWEKPDDTLSCANSVIKEIDRSREIVESQIFLVDNGSTDNSLDAINSWLIDVDRPYIHFISNPTNLGFSGGMNTGISAAIAADEFDYFWLLNNDVILEHDALSSIVVDALATPQCAIWGPTVIDVISGRIQCAGGCTYNRWLGMSRRSYEGSDIADIEASANLQFDYIYGAAMFIRGDLLKRTNGLDERYFLFYEELELAKRIKSTDKVGWCRPCLVTHRGSDSPTQTKGSRALTAYHASISAFIYTKRYHAVCLPTVIISRIMGLAVLAIRYNNLQLAIAPLRALWDFFLSKSSQSI